MAPYSLIIIIYNPNSTGGSKAKAGQTQKKLKRALPDTPIKLVATEYKAHGEKIAYETAKSSPHALIISVSGDGGYNEVVNGVMKAKAEGAKATTSLIPAGNANDHYHSMKNGKLIERVMHGTERSIDLLKLTVTSSEGTSSRFAHSYMGLGLTPHAGHELNKTKVTKFKEILIVAKTFLASEHVKLRVGGRIDQYRSIVFCNISRMAKIKIPLEGSAVDDGKFEIFAQQHKSKLMFALSLLKVSLPGYVQTEQTSRYSFQTIRSTLIQLDGEVIRVPANAKVAIEIEPKSLQCIVARRYTVARRTKQAPKVADDLADDEALA